MRPEPMAAKKVKPNTIRSTDNLPHLTDAAQ
jgi:hypothetical protein